MARIHSATPSTAGKVAILAIGLGLVAFAVSPARAQDPQMQSQSTGMKGQAVEMDMSRPAPILVIYREDVKAGRVTLHDQLETNFARTYARMPGAQYFLAMNSLTGPSQSWFLQPYQSLEDVQKESQASDHAPVAIKTALERITGGETDNLTNQQSIITVYRADLSHNPDIKNLPHARYMEVSTYRVQPGHDAEFVEAANMIREAHEKSNQPMPWATYQVFAGGPSGTYYVFRSLDSLNEADPASSATMMKAVNTALGNDGQKRLMQLVADAHIMRETNFYTLNPKTSYAPPAFAAADSFWSQPAQLAQVGTSGKTPKVNRTKREKKQQ